MCVAQNFLEQTVVHLRLRLSRDQKMKLLAFLRNHTHYWGVPHPRNEDDRLVQTCYECGAERVIKIELRPSTLDDLTLPIDGDHLAA